jgi:hypothetical protein
MGLSASAAIDKKGHNRKHRLHRYRRCKRSFPGSNVQLDRMQQKINVAFDLALII